MFRKGILFVISGPSGVGKGTIIDSVISNFSDLNLSVSVTTREPRANEIDGREYFFVPVSKFQQMVADGELLEWAKVYDNFYGTPRQMVLDHLKSNQDILLELDIQGALKVKKTMPNAVFIFIAPPSFEDLMQRIEKRGKDSQSSIETRMKSYESEMQYMEYYDYVVINENLNIAISVVSAIITAERCRYNNILR